MTYIEELDSYLITILNDDRLSKIQKIILQQTISCEKLGIYKPLHKDDYYKDQVLFNILIEKLQHFLIIQAKKEISTINWWLGKSIIIDDLYYVSQNMLSHWFHYLYNENKNFIEIENTNEFIKIYNLNDLLLFQTITYNDTPEIFFIPVVNVTVYIEFELRGAVGVKVAVTPE